MPNAIEELFEAIDGRGCEPWLTKVSGTVRFDVVDGPRTDSWTVAIRRGELSVTHERAAADCAVVVEGSLLARLARGEANAMTAVLRNEIRCHGDIDLLLAVQRIFPGAQSA